MPELHVAFVLLLTVLALGLFATEKIRLESAALLVLICLVVVTAMMPFTTAGGERFDPAGLFTAFGNEALVAVCALMVLGQGVQTTRALQPLVATISRYWEKAPLVMLLGVLVAAAMLSAFLNNTPIVVILLPALVAIANQNNVAPSKYLMPVGYSTILGGMATTIGTSTNLLVVNLSEDIANVRFGMFDFSGYVLIAGSAGLLYLWLLAPRLSPARSVDNRQREQRDFVATLRVRAESKLVGASVADFMKLSGRALQIIHIIDSQGKIRAPLPTTEFDADDRILVYGNKSALKEAETVLQAPLTDFKSQQHQDPATEPKLAEVLVTADSECNGKTMEEINFQSSFGLAVVALRRRRGTPRELAQVPTTVQLEVGDIILCEGTEKQLKHIMENTSLMLLQRTTELPFTHRSTVALAITGLVVIVAALGVLPISISALTGVGLMLATRCIGWQHVRRALDTQIIMVIVVSLALGRALMATGGDTYLAELFSGLLTGASPFVVVSTLMLGAAVLTNVVTNNAAAVIAVPIAVQIAKQLEISVEPMLLAVLFGANLCFVTPIAYQTNLLVLSAGGYRFVDFVRIGLPLTLIMWGILSWLLRLQYGL